MVYEIYYEPKGAVWRLRIITIYCGFLAVSCTVCTKVVKDGAACSYVPMDFETYEKAQAEVTHIGLDKAYALRDRRGSFSTLLNSVGVHASTA